MVTETWSLGRDWDVPQIRGPFLLGPSARLHPQALTHGCIYVPEFQQMECDWKWGIPPPVTLQSLSNLLLQLFPCLAYPDGADAQGDLKSHLLKVAQLLATCYLEGEVCCQRGMPALSYSESEKEAPVLFELLYIWESVCCNSLTYPAEHTTLIFKPSLCNRCSFFLYRGETEAQCEEVTFSLSQVIRVARQSLNLG